MVRRFLRALAAAPVAVAAVAFVAPQDPQAPAPVRRDSAISGVVIDESTRQPVADAVVQLGSVALREFPEILRRQFTDARGRFVFADLPAGFDYTVTAAKPGYFDGAYGRSDRAHAPRRAIALADGEWFRDAVIPLARPGSLAGTLADERGEPVVGVFVRLLAFVRAGGRDRIAVGGLVTTDDRGMYRFGQLRPGRYVVMVPAARASAHASTPAATLLGLTEQALASAQAAGRPPNAEPMIDAGAGMRLAVGGYPVPPPPANGQVFTYPMAFSGGRTLAQAAPVVLGSGEHRPGVDIRLVPVPAVRISGVVEGPAEALAGLSLRLLAEGAEELGLGGEAGTALVAADGSFTFAGVPAGAYTIDAPVAINQVVLSATSFSIFYGPQQSRPPGLPPTSTIAGTMAGAPFGVGFGVTSLGDRRFWGRATVTAGAGGAEGVVIRMRPAGFVRGRLAGEPDPARPEPEQPPRFIHLESTRGSVWEGAPRSVSTRALPAGEFLIEGVLPGLYHFRGESTPWMLKSVLVEGREHIRRPLDATVRQEFTGVVATFTNAVPSLEGTARDERGAPAADAIVVVFPAEPEEWSGLGLVASRLRSARASTAGSYRLRSIPAGDYHVAAVPEAQSGDWQAPEFLARLRAWAARVTIGWGEHKVVDARVVEVR